MAQAALKETETAPAPKPRVFLSPSRFVEPGHARRVHLATVPNGVTLEDVQQSYFFKQCESRPISIGDKIECRDDALSFYAELLVVSCTATGSQVETRVIHHVKLDEAKVEVGHSDDYEARWTGVTTKWRVFRVKDQHEMPGSFTTRGDAEQHIRSTLRQRKV